MLLVRSIIGGDSTALFTELWRRWRLRFGDPFCGCRPERRLGPTDVALCRYGPYSFAVADALEALKAGGLVEEEPAAVYAPCLGAGSTS